MKQTVSKIHAAGLKAGVYTCTGAIEPSDSWVSPVPDPRLVAQKVYTLAEVIDARSDTVLTVEGLDEGSVAWNRGNHGMNVLRIDNELILSRGFSHGKPNGFTKCTRGAFGTTPAPHAAGARAGHLRFVYRVFYPDKSTDLVDELADCLARVYNECELDFIFLDYAEGMGFGNGITIMHNAICERLNRPAIIESSAPGTQLWPFASRVGYGDSPVWGLKAWTDMRCEDISDLRKSALLQPMLGWWEITGPAASYRGAMPDEMEYFCCKALAFDTSLSIGGVEVGQAPPNARQEEYLTTTGRYERLRLAGYFREAVKERLRTPRQDFHLVRADDGEWQFEPTDYISRRVRGDGETPATWTVTNHYDAQRPSLRIEMLYSALAPDAPGGVLVTDFSGPDLVSTRRTAPGVSQTVGVTTERVRESEQALRLQVTNTTAPRNAFWAHTGIRFDPHLDLKACRALGLWIHGDGGGEVLNVQLGNPSNNPEPEHYIDVDFTGWRYVVLLLRERDADRYPDYKWPYYSQILSDVFLNRLIRNHVNQLNLYVNNVPEGGQVDIVVGPIRALPTCKTRLENPTVTIGDRPVVFKGRFTSGTYIECDPDGACRLFDERGSLLQRAHIGALPVLAAGPQSVSFRSTGQDGRSARAEVTIVTRGKRFGGKKPAESIRQERLDRDYATPHIVT